MVISMLLWNQMITDFGMKAVDNLCMKIGKSFSLIGKMFNVLRII